MNDDKNKPLSLDIRYTSAWSEINTRIAQRQNAISIYTSIAFAGLGAAIIGKSVSYSGLWTLCYAVPIAGILFYLLVLMHERMIHNLHVFCAKCEELAVVKSENNEYHLPSYHVVGDIYYEPAKSARRLGDLVALILVSVPNFISGYLAYVNSETATWTMRVSQISLYAVSLAVILYCAGSIYKVRHPKPVQQNILPTVPAKIDVAAKDQKPIPSGGPAENEKADAQTSTPAV